MVGFDINWVRSQFPALAQKIDGRDVVFFDGPGGTQMPAIAIEAVQNYLTNHNANSGGLFSTSKDTDNIIVRAHQAMADFLGCEEDEVFIGANMTTLTFSLSRAIGRTLEKGDEIIVTRLDHDANVSPWLALEEERGVVVRFADVKVADCTLDMDQFKTLINKKTRLIAVGYASNAVGTINNIAEIVKLAHAAKALVFVDAVHYAPHGPIDVRALECDFLACSPYKFFAPHAGAIYGKRALLSDLQPYKVRPATQKLPYRWETGTQNHEAMAGIVSAIDYLAELGRRITGSSTLARRQAVTTAMTEIQKYEQQLTKRLVTGLLSIPGLTFYGITDPANFDKRTPTVAVRIENFTPAELAERLGNRGIFTWDGNYYALGLTQVLGVEDKGGMLRIGCVHYNTVEEIDRFLNELGAVLKEKTLAAAHC